MKRYLSVIPLEEALTFLKHIPIPLCVDTVPIEESSGRITASPVFATYSVPEVHLAAMDGIAIRSEDTIGASEQSPIRLQDARRVNTGNVVPPEYDAVIMIEDVWVDGETFTIRKPASPWQHVRPAGEDIAESEMILPSLHRIRPSDIGALAAYGITEIPVFGFRAGLIPTGSELVAPGIRPGPGQVVESNTRMAASWLSALGGTCTRYPLTPDRSDVIRDVLAKAAGENDLVIISAGSSAGTKDYTADVIAGLGEVLVHGVAIKPGKPVIIGKLGKIPVIGLPGYPLSALTVLRELVTPLVRFSGIPVPEPGIIPARLTSTLHSDAGTDEFVLLSAGRIGSSWVATPLSRGAGIQMSAVRSNAYLRIISPLEGYEAGENVLISLTVTDHEAEEAILVTGSHDPVLDHLSELVRHERVDLHSSHVGSMGGLIALKRNDCHAAPVHLLAPNGDYNIPFLEKYLPRQEIDLVCVAGREQGIVSREGLSIDDLPGRSFINRQKGSGTRVLLDHELHLRGIPKEDIPGYEREATTHIGVALAVKTGEAEAGLCVYSAARALGLPFVPVAKERYEIAIRREHMEDSRISALLGAIRSPRFREILRELGGYDDSITGVLRQVP
ncbi:MAG: molybdopterin biosynthesis protein MoeA [Methanoregulaceae archaeon PtaB.Bin108]|nr:MAG: molybdopterin biosynthesis protein MoeA [Methanoregulaceae archaeon PtaB.Bin108]